MATKGKGKKRGKRKKDPSIINLAKELAQAQFAAPLAQGRQQVRELEQRKPATTQAYGELAQQHRDAGAATLETTRQENERQQGAGGAMADAQIQLGSEQQARAQEAMIGFGQTAAAAEQAAKDAGGAATALAGQSQDSQAFLAALGTIGNQQAQGHAVQAGRQGVEANLQLDREIDETRKGIAGIKAERGAAAAKIAQELVDDMRDYQLALMTLNQRDKDSMRDFKIQRRGLLQRMREMRITAAQTDRQMDHDERLDWQEFGLKSDDQDLKGRDSDNDGVIDSQDPAPATPGDDRPSQKVQGKRDAAGKRGRDGDVKYRVGKKEFVYLTPKQKQKATQLRGEVKTWAATDPRNRPRGVKPWQVEVGKYYATGAPIPKHYKAHLRKHFEAIGGYIPRDIAKLIEG